jgi:lysyl-tRNA synthetase class 2
MLDKIKQDRLKKLDNFKKAGMEGFPAGPFAKEDLVEVLRREEGKEVQVAGRVVLKREMGNITFLHLQDQSGRGQIVINKKELDEAGKGDLGGDYKFWVKNLDLGDFVGVAGRRFNTQKGERSVLAHKLTLLTKSLRPLPDKFKGLENEDRRQRFRELELITQRESLEKFQRRSAAIEAIRRFMWRHNFSEVETPVLQAVYGGTYAKPFVTRHNALDFQLFLRIAPEMFLKRLTTGGFERVFEIGKCFRNEGMDPSHLQEFTMFEFYWAYADYEQLMEFTEQMISEVVEKVYDGNYEVTFGEEKIDLRPPYRRVTFRELIKEQLGVEFEDLDSVEKVEKYIQEQGLAEQIDLSGKVSWSAKIDELYKKTVRKKLIQPVFVTDYPKEFMALAKEKADQPGTVATFQLVINSWEMLKAYNELNDPVDQKERFETQERLQAAGEEEAMPYDHDFVESMEYGMPPMAGWGMGLDRFFSLLEEEENLRDLVLFPTMKPLGQEQVCNLLPEDDKGSRYHTCSRPEFQGEGTDGEGTELKGPSSAAGTELQARSSNNEEEGELGIDYPTAQKLLEEHLLDPIDRLHSRETELIMRALARHFGQDEEKWGIIGLLHDIDWEETKNQTELHCVKTREILQAAGGTDFLIEAIQSHAYGQANQEESQAEYYGAPEFKDKRRTTRLQHALAAAETVTGLIMATAKVRPDGKLTSVKLSSLKKKFKTKSFAAGCNREIIRECEEIGLTLEEFLEVALKALQEKESELLG